MSTHLEPLLNRPPPYISFSFHHTVPRVAGQHGGHHQGIRVRGGCMLLWWAVRITSNTPC